MPHADHPTRRGGLQVAPGDRPIATVNITDPAALQAFIINMPAEVDAAKALGRRDAHEEYQRGKRDGFDLGFRLGRQAEAAEMAEAWRTHVRKVLEQADPAGPEARDSAARRIQAALSGERHDAADHRRRFMAQARVASPASLTAAQAAAVNGRKGGEAA